MSEKKTRKKTKFNIAVSSVQVSRLHLSRYKNYLILKTRNAERCVCVIDREYLYVLLIAILF